MIRVLSVALACGLAAPTLAAPPASEDAKVVYALGLLMSDQLSGFKFSAEELEVLIAGLRDGTAKVKHGLDIKAYQAKIAALAKGRVLAAGKAVRDEAATAKGAVQTPSGLVYIPETAGVGASPTLDDTVKVHYHGTLPDGTVFDSSVERGEPITFQLRGVVPCWKEGVPMMKAGGKARLVCPPELAYGDRGAPPKIGPGATLIFDVQLLEVTPAAK